MISFKNDYSEGACNEIMQALVDSNEVQTDGYGLDPICEEARSLIKDKLADELADVHFLVGGTQANQTIIASFLRPYEAVIAVTSGHINVHETGAIEATGHKVLTTLGIDGKIIPSEIEAIVLSHSDEHMVKPAMVYISNATEIGTVYSLSELKKIRQVCDQYHLTLFMDGARLGSAMVASDNDVTWSDFKDIVDVMYIGGTKNGALFGEACVIFNQDYQPFFRYHMKQRGGMLAKGRLLGIQFACLMKDNLLEKLAKHAVTQAQRLQTAFQEAGYAFYIETTTNQIFPILSNEVAKALSKEFAFQVWETIDEEHCAYRMVTSWATKEADVDALIASIQK